MTYYERNRDAMLSYNKEKHRLRRLICLQKYSGSIPFCNCCGEKTIEFLSIDHINGGGSKHREAITKDGGNGRNMPWWLIKNNFPSGYQVLCHNCNMAKGLYGKCPHKMV